MLVVVYLIAAKKYIIIPQEWIMSLTQESLNNIGKASYQNRRIFWSNVRVNSDGIPDSSIVADFRRNVSVTFPPNTDAACYIARVKCFCATLDRAKYFRDTFRPQIPVLYNVRKQFKVQLPSVLLNNQNTNNSHSLIDRRPNGIPVEDEPETQAEPIAGPSVDHDISLNENSNEFQEEQESESSVGSYVADEEKCVMPIIELNETDSMAISNVFDEEQMDGAQDNDTEYEVPVLASTATTFQDGGVLKVKRVYADDCEMIYPLGVKLMPRDPLYQVKVNDPISLHIPYKENVSSFKAAFKQIFIFNSSYTGEGRSSIFVNDKEWTQRSFFSG